MFNRIKIFSIATNKHNAFKEPFLTSFSKYFLPSVQKEFFLFTDDPSLHLESISANLVQIKIDHQPWPMITLKRYENINLLAEKIHDTDLCIFADIDLEVNCAITDFNVTKKFFGTCHPGNLIPPGHMIDSLEDNMKSTAFVDKQTIPYGYEYIQGCFWGGIGLNFINLVQTLNKNTLIDLKNNIIAKWYDESHLNRFYLDNFENFDIKSPGFAHPEGWDVNLGIPKFIAHKHKDNITYHQ
jgi:hypothetical protein